jgi:hypothetical protein
MREQKFARIHPEAQTGTGSSVVQVKLNDACGVAFRRGQGPYKGWYPVAEEQIRKLGTKYVSPGNPNSMRIFQIAGKEEVDAIAASEARTRMSPEQARLSTAHDSELKAMKGKLEKLEPLIKLLSNPAALVAHLQKINDTANALADKSMSQEEGDRAERIARGTPRRAPLDETHLDDDDERRASAARTEPSNQAGGGGRPPPPPARPGDGKASSKKKPDASKADPSVPPHAGAANARPGIAASVALDEVRSATAAAANPTAPSAGDIAAVAAALELDEDEEAGQR